MKIFKTLIIISTLGALVLTGCSKKSSTPTEPSFDLTQFEASPGDGATGVRLDAAVSLWFSKPVDRALVEGGFMLISEKDMSDAVCPIANWMNHGTMAGSMIDSSKMHHLDQYHSTRGRFIWNNDSTLCTFKPDSLMSSKTQHMLHLGRGIITMMQKRWGTMAMMSGHGAGPMGDEMMFHFYTLDVTQQGSGHNGHH